MRKQSNSRSIFERAQQLIPGGVNSPVRAFRSVGGEPFVVERGQGAYLYDVDGNRYIDYVNSWGPLVLGHAHPLVIEAIRSQLEKGTTYGACCALEGQLAEKVIGLFPNIDLVRFVNSGTEAGMSVIRLARAFTEKNKIIKFSGCYHGHTDSMLTQAGSGVATLGLPDSPGVPVASTQDTLSAEYNDLDSVVELFEEFSGEIAAVIVEPVLGNAGFIEPTNDFLRELRRLTERHQALLIFDEVMTGFRVNLGGAQKLFGIKPDLTMLGKVIGGGLPVGAYGGRREVMELVAPLGPVYQAGTLSGNPLAMAAGLATLNEWSRPGVFESVERGCQELVHGLRELALSASIPLCANSIGTMFGFFFQAGPVNNYQEAKLSDLERFSTFFNLMLDQGVYFAQSQFEAGFVSVAHLGEPIEQTLRSLDKVFGQL